MTKKPSPKFGQSLKSTILAVAAVASMAALVAVSSMGACSGSNTGNLDMTSTGDMFFSCCGKPGDPGNSMGIGQYCVKTADCTNGQAPICANDFYPDRKTYFCTSTCDGPDMGSKGCGADSTCTKDRVSGLYGCVPSACLVNMPPGCMN